MEAIELLAIIILIAAIVIIVYYYLQTVNGGSFDVNDLRNSFTIPKKEDIQSIRIDDDLREKVSVGDKIKSSFKDIDKSYANTTDDLESLEKRCISACDSIDDLEKRFSEYSTVTNEKIEDLDNRLKALEEEEKLLEAEAE